MARIRQVARNLTPIASLKTKRFEPHHLNTGRPDLHFMSGVREIRQTDDVHTQWILEIAGQTREFDATITEQHPDERIAWKSDAGSISLTVFRRISISKFPIPANDRRT
ncbi:SRPBCC family protein [Peribacillus sp. NPDC097284]